MVNVYLQPKWVVWLNSVTVKLPTPFLLEHPESTPFLSLSLSHPLFRYLSLPLSYLFYSWVFIFEILSQEKKQPG